MKKYFAEVYLLSLSMYLIGLSVNAQTIHQVNVSGFSFTPSNLIINTGDKVVWSNTGGFHNVNGTIETYPDNPESFGNSAQNAPWEYSHIFNVAGSYDYQCDIHLSSGMTGTITVNTPTFVEDRSTNDSGVLIYPQPAYDFINIDLGSAFSQNSYQMLIYNLLGSKVLQAELFANSINRINISKLPSSTYLYNIQNTDGILTTGKLLIH